MSFFIALLLTIFVLMYASKNFPGVITGTIKIFFTVAILIILFFVIRNYY